MQRLWLQDSIQKNLKNHVVKVDRKEKLKNTFVDPNVIAESKTTYFVH